MAAENRTGSVYSRKYTTYCMNGWIILGIKALLTVYKLFEPAEWNGSVVTNIVTIKPFHARVYQIEQNRTEQKFYLDINYTVSSLSNTFMNTYIDHTITF